MIARPWVLPDEVKAYSDLADVQARDNAKLAFDIARAEQYIISITNNKFDAETLTVLPTPVRQAVILVTERYAHIAYQQTQAYTTETLDDYSYTANEISTDMSDLNLSALLKDYTLDVPNGSITMRLWTL